jgi:hypothetical protein
VPFGLGRELGRLNLCSHGTRAESPNAYKVSDGGSVARPLPGRRRSEQRA